MKSVFIRVYPWLFFAGSLMAADPISDALQKGLFEEEANHNFDAAIKAYQSVIDQTAEQRKLAATAVFRLGECYRKLNKTNDAIGQYQRILREYSDVTTLATLSQQNLSGLGISAPENSAAVAATSAEVEEIAKIKAMIKDSPDLINSRDASEQMPLHKAAQNGYLAVARFLLANKADVNARDNGSDMPLHRATAMGHKTMVELLLDHGADVNARGRQQHRPLHLAAYRGYRAIVELLVARKADVNGKGEFGNTPLHVAAFGGQTAIVEYLLDHGADLEAVNDAEGNTPLLAAASSREVGACRVLLEHGANVNAQNVRGMAPLHYATSSPELLQLLLNHKPDLELQDKQQQTPLRWAIYNAPDSRSIELLLKAGANPNQAGNTTPLMAAIQKINPEKVRLLLQFKADPNQPVDGVTPLAWALYSPGRAPTASEKVNLAEIADLLRKHGAKDEGIKVAASTPVGQMIAPRVVRDLQAEEIERLQKVIKDSPDLINAKDNSGQTALHRAASDGQDKVIQFLLTNKAEINIQNAKKNTPLHNAVIAGQGHTVDLLLTNGADVNAIGSEGNPQIDRSTLSVCQALHMAALRGNQAIAERLIAAKADVNGRDDHGRTPLRFAVNGGFQNLVTLLISKGADPNIPDDQGRTPAMLALANDFQNILHTLLEESVYLNAQDGGGNTLLHQAAEQRPPRNLQMILGKRPDLEIENKDQRTPLMVALASQNVQAARMLLEAGANPNHRNGRGEFPLLIAAANANKEAVELLLDRKADVNQKNLENGTVLGYVLAITGSAPSYRQKPLREIADLLRKHGAKEEVSSAKAKP